MLRTAAGTSPRILVVDPHPRVGALIERYVLMSGALAVRQADSPLAALHHIQDRRLAIDCVIAAHDMAPTTGLDFLCTLRAGRYGSGPSIRLLPFVLILVHENATICAAANAAGSATVLVHPFDREMLAHAIQHVISPARILIPDDGATNTQDSDWSQRYHPDGVPEAFGHIDRRHAPDCASNHTYIARTADEEAAFASLAEAERWLRVHLKSGRRLVKG